MTGEQQPRVPPEPASISGRLDSLLETLPEAYDWAGVEKKVIERLMELPRIEETALAGWLYWLFFVGMLGVVAVGWLRLLPFIGGRLLMDRLLPAAGSSLMIMSALGLVWAASGGVRPAPAGEGVPSGIRWLIVAAGTSAALAGTVVALVPLASAHRLPDGMVPLLILFAASGLVAGLALEVRHARDRLALPLTDALRRVALVLGVLFAVLGAVLETWFVLFF